jgi:hypothetical protein
MPTMIIEIGRNGEKANEFVFNGSLDYLNLVSKCFEALRALQKDKTNAGKQCYNLTMGQFAARLEAAYHKRSVKVNEYECTLKDDNIFYVHTPNGDIMAVPEFVFF